MRCALLVLLLQPLIASADPPSDTVSNSTSLADVSTREAGLTRAGLLPDGWIDPRGTVAVDTSGVILVGTANLRAVPIEGIELSASIDWNIISDEESVPDRIERVTLRGRLWSSPRVSIAAMASGGYRDERGTDRVSGVSSWVAGAGIGAIGCIDPRCWVIGRAHVAFGREFDAMSSPGNDPQFEEHRLFVGGGLEIGQRRLHGIVAGEVADGTDNSFGLYAGGRVSGRHFAFDLGVTHLKGVRVPVPMLGLALRR